MVEDVRTVDRPDAPIVPPDLLAKVIAYYDPVQVILFGSQARGDRGPDSDVDLMACPVSVFRARARISGSFAETITAEGVVVYERR